MTKSQILADRIEARVIDPANETSSEALTENIREIIALVRGAGGLIPEPVARAGDWVKVKNRRVTKKDPWERAIVKSIHWHDYSGQGGGQWWRYRVETCRPRNNIMLTVDGRDLLVDVKGT